MKNTLEGINSKINGAEQISDLGNRLMEITAVEQNKENRMTRNEVSLRNLWDNIKCINIHIIGVPEGEERERRLKEIFEEIIAENFPNIGKEMVKQVQEASTESLRHNKPKEEHTKTHSNQKDKKLR